MESHTHLENLLKSYEHYPHGEKMKVYTQKQLLLKQDYPEFF